MKQYFSFLAMLFLVTSLTLQAQTKIEFDAPGVYPEGVSYDAAADVFYVSGDRTATVGKVNRAGKYTEIFSDSTLKSTIGIKVDAAQKKLWVCAGDPNNSKYRDSSTYRKMIRLVGIDLTTGKKVNDINLTNLYQGEHFANDVTLDGKGNLYITDSYSPAIYKVDANGKASVFVQSPLFWGAGIGLNGIVYNSNGYLLVANGGAGNVLKVNVNNPKEITKVKIKQFFPGADGLLLDGPDNLILVQNKGVNKVFKISTKDNWMTGEVVAATPAKLMFSQPSTATMAGKQVWIMNSKLNELTDSMSVISSKFSIQLAEFEPVK